MFALHAHTFLAARWQAADRAPIFSEEAGHDRRLFVVLDARAADAETLRSVIAQISGVEDAFGRRPEIAVATTPEVAGAVFYAYEGRPVEQWEETSVYGHLVFRYPTPQLDDPRKNDVFAVHFGDSAVARAFFPFTPDWAAEVHDVYGLRLVVGAVLPPDWMARAPRAGWGEFLPLPEAAPRTRLLGDWIAVEPLDQGEGDVQDEFSGLWLPATRKAREDAVRGRVLLCGPRVPPEIRPGMVVHFQRFSGHPGQTDPIPAETFGGTAGRWCALVRLVEGPVVEHLEERRAEFQKHLKNLEQLAPVVDAKSRPRLLMLLDHYRYELRRVNEQLYRVPGLRTRRAHPIEMPWSVGRGVEAIEEDVCADRA